MKEYSFALFVVNAYSIQNRNLVKYIKELLDSELGDFYTLKIVDILTDPEDSKKCGIVVVPTLAKCSPGRVEKMFGNFTNSAVFRKIIKRIHDVNG